MTSATAIADPAIAATLEAMRAAIEQALAGVLPAEDAWPATIHRAARYSLLGGGKRIRPLLVLASGEAVGGNREELLPFACAVEMVHTYSLIHDDLPAMDNDDLRRGQPTCHKVFGEAIAILAGDALLTHAFQVLADVSPEPDANRVGRRLRACAILAEAGGTSGLIGGQVADLEAEGRSIGAADLDRLHRAKTGALLSACVRGGAVLGSAGDEELECLGRFASAIGLAFQVVDDILDATGTAESLGKTPGKDAAAHKSTYVSLHGLERAREMAAQLRRQALDALAPLGPRGTVLAAIGRRIVDRRS